MTELPSSYVIVDGRSKQVFSPDTPFQMLGVIALDLPHDLWRDFLVFMEEARKAEDAGDAEKRYRFLRASCCACSPTSMRFLTCSSIR
jgi:hypothetical protein